MFSKFNYTPSDSFYMNELNKYITFGEDLYNTNKKEIEKNLSEFISEDGVINGSKLKANWFSVSKKDIFISHSHKDIQKVKAFAGWLKKNFGLDAFIDSCCWGYCDDLLSKIDDRYCYNPSTETFNYRLRNYTTSHVHMMLATALTEMMDQTECVIFFNTPNSINMNEELDNINNDKKTKSPWIYHELMMTSMLRENEPKRKSIVLEHSFSKHLDAKNEFQVEYDVDKVVKSMPTLSDFKLQIWCERWKNTTKGFNDSPLDLLYSIVFPK